MTEHTPALANESMTMWQIFVVEWLKPLLVMVVLVLVMQLVFPRYIVKGQSMDPLLHESDRLFVLDRHATLADIQRGDVVVIRSPYDEKRAVKRIVGLPGETVEAANGTIYVNGVPLEEPYLVERPLYSGAWIVGPGEYFVLGDNRNHSIDSHRYGPVSLDRIRGVVKFRFFPLTHLSWFAQPEYE